MKHYVYFKAYGGSGALPIFLSWQQVLSLAVCHHVLQWVCVSHPSLCHVPYGVLYH